MNHVLLYDYDVCQELVVMESDTEKNTHTILQMRTSRAEMFKQTFMFFNSVETYLSRDSRGSNPKDPVIRKMGAFYFLSDSYGIRLVPIVSKMRKIKSLAITIIIFS